MSRRGKRGKGTEFGGDIISQSERLQQPGYIARYLEQIAFDKAIVDAMNQSYLASDKTSKLRKRDKIHS